MEQAVKQDREYPCISIESTAHRDFKNKNAHVRNTMQNVQKHN